MNANESYFEADPERRVTLDDFNAIEGDGPRVYLDDLNDIAADELPPFRLNVRTASEICATPDPPESDLLLGPLVVRGARTVIVGDTGHGKTTLALQLGSAVLTGAECLGYQGATDGPLLVFDLEQGERSIKRVLREAGLAQRSDVVYVAVPDGLELDSNEDDRSELERIVAATRPGALILDPYYKAHRADANEERGVVDLMRYLDALRARYGFSLILPAHPRKETVASNGARKLSLSDVFGSGAVTRGAELVIGIERLSHGYARVRFLKDRDFDLPVGDTWPLIFSKDQGFKLDPKEEQTADELETRVVSASDAWRTVKEWASELGIREKRAGALLETLAEAGHVEFMEGPPGRSPKAKCYRTSPTPRAKSGEVTQSSLDVVTAPTAPPSLGDVALGAVDTTAPEWGAEDENPDHDTEPEPTPDEPDEQAPLASWAVGA